jgi:hypothetical protein
MLLKLFFEVSVTLIPKQKKDKVKEENYRSMYLVNKDAKTIKYMQTKFNDIKNITYRSGTCELCL